ncbi:MAG: diguanylate cyclase [Boseongicola sp.]|nr:MAG: diguanylate cyclase [Boseongicola sp.]
MSSRILVIDHVPTTRMLLSSLLSASQYHVATAVSVDEAARATKQQRPDVILAGVGAIGPTHIMELLREAGVVSFQNATVPVICIDPDGTPERRLDALRSGARELLGYPCPDCLLLARMRNVLREAGGAREILRRKSAAASLGFAEEATVFRRAGRVALVAEDPNCIPGNSALVEKFGQNLTLLTAAEAMALSSDSPAIDAFVLDGACQPKMRMLGTLPELRARDHTRHASVLVTHESDDVDAAILALDSGASDVVDCNALGEELVMRVENLLERKAASDALRQMSESGLQLAVTDTLTNLFNRRYAEAYLSDTIAAAETTRQPFTLMMVDIDHFKGINDSLGHAAGDAVLKAVAKRMRKNLRSVDLVARFGGEEFLVVLPGTNSDLAELAANRLRSRTCDTPIRLSDDQKIDVTVSIGVTVSGLRPLAERHANCAPSTDRIAAKSTKRVANRLLRMADSALYAAKASGRNRVEMAVNRA